VAAGLAAFRPEGAQPADEVFAGLDLPRAAEALRSDLATAGIDRPELFERSAARRPLRVHDLRATFVTLALAAGRSETWVADRTGHRSSVMIHRYRRQARQAAELNLGELAPLDGAIPELASGRESAQGEPQGEPQTPGAVSIQQETCSIAPRRQGISKRLLTFTTLPVNSGMRARRNSIFTQLPVVVPSNLLEMIDTEATLPDGS
jgi:hypothetical protein